MVKYTFNLSKNTPTDKLIQTLAILRPEQNILCNTLLTIQKLITYNSQAMEDDVKCYLKLLQNSIAA